MRQGESPLRALTDEQQRGRPKDRPLLLLFPKFEPFRTSVISVLTPLRVFVRWLLGVWDLMFPWSLMLGIWSFLIQLCPSFLDFSVAARTALITVPRILPFSNSCRPSMVVPPGLVTMSFSAPG